MDTSSCLKSIKQDTGDSSTFSFSNNANSESLKNPNIHAMNSGQITLSADATIKRKPGRPKKFSRSPFSLSSLTLDSPNSSSRARFSLPSSYIGSFTKKHEEQFTPTAISTNTYGRGKKSLAITDVVSKRRRMKSILKKTSPSIPMENGYVNDLNPSGDGNADIASTANDVSTSTSSKHHKTNSSVETVDATNSTSSTPPFSSNSSIYYSNPSAKIPFSSTSSIHYSNPSQPLLNTTSVTSESLLSTSIPGVVSNFQVAARNASEGDSQALFQTAAQTVSLSASRLSMAPSFPSLQDQHVHYPTACSSSHSQYPGNFEVNLLSRLLPQAEAAICAGRVAGLSGPHIWTSEMVAAFISTLPGCSHLSHIFLENEIDGPALLCLEQQDLMLALNLKLGPAVKIFGAIRTFRRTMMAIPYSDLSVDRDVVKAAVASCFKPIRDSFPLPQLSASFPVPVAIESVITRTILNTTESTDTPRINGLPPLTDVEMPLKNVFE